MAELFHSHSRSARLDQVLNDLLGRTPELQAASVVSFDGLPMASALPTGMDEDRVAAMSAALLSLGERAAENFGRGSLNQVYVEGENGTVFLVSAEDEAVLVAVGAKGAKVGLLMFEVRRSATSVADALRADDVSAAPAEPTVLYPPAGATEPETGHRDGPAAGWEQPTAAVPAPEPLAPAPTLHVVDGGYDASPPMPATTGSAHAELTDHPAHLLDEPAASGYPQAAHALAWEYEAPEPESYPAAEAYPGEMAPPVSGWAHPLSAVNPPEPRREVSHWTAYDQTRYQAGEADLGAEPPQADPSAAEPTGYEQGGYEQGGLDAGPGPERWS